MTVGRTILSRQGLKDRGIRLSNVWLLKLERDGRFPARIYITERTVGWDAAEIDAWIQSRVAERERAHPQPSL